MSGLPSLSVSGVRGAETCGLPNQVSRKEREQSAQLLLRPGTVLPPSFCSWAHDSKGLAKRCGVPSALRGMAFSSSC